MHSKDKVTAHLDKSIIKNILQNARASLKEPSKPYTPTEQARSLFSNSEVTRPTSAYSLKSLAKELEPIKPKQLALEVPVKTGRKVLSEGEKLGPRKPVKVVYNEKVVESEEKVENEDFGFGELLKVVDRIKYDTEFRENLTDDELEVILEEFSECLVEVSYSNEKSRWLNSKQMLKSLAMSLEVFTGDIRKTLKICKCLLENITNHGLLYIKKSKGLATSPLALGAIKYLYQYSKEALNDLIFIQEGVVDTLYSVLISVVSEDSFEKIELPYEFLLYLLGILKNLTNNSEAAEECFRFFNLLTSLMPNPYLEETPISNSKHSDLLVQITGIIKNLTCEQSLEQILDYQILEKLAVMIFIYKDPEIILNCYKALVKVSKQEVVSASLVKFTKVFIESIENSTDLLVLTRALYIQANILTLYPTECESELNLSNIFQHWVLLISTSNIIELDFLIKTVRFLNNLLSSKSYPVTPSFSEELLKNLLETLSKNSISSNEELTLNTVSCISNLLYYDTPYNTLLSDHSRLCTLSKVSTLLVNSFNEEVTIEVLRSLSNLTRHEQICKQLPSLFLIEIFLMMLNHSNWNIVYYTLGCFINVSGSSKEILYTERIFEALLDLLSEVEKVEKGFCQQVLMIFCNLCGGSKELVAWESVAGEENVARLNSVVRRVLDLEADEELKGVAKDLESFMPKPWVSCLFEECGRKFPNKAQLDEHVLRRHK